jgi:aromatic ring-opening dioxygenase LigB subunit
MPLVFAAITPHPPFLVPGIGKDVADRVSKTRLALEKLEEDIYLSKPDVIMIFSPHSNLIDDAFTINVSPEFEADFKEFGDVTTKLHFQGEMSLAAAIREASVEDKTFPVVLTSERSLDHGIAIPLCLLAQHLPQVAILPIGFCGLSAEVHLNFGKFLKERIMQSTKRVAVIASADLSHALTAEAPKPFHPSGPQFDARIQELLIAKKTDEIVAFDPAQILQAAECGFRSIVMLLGVLHNISYTYTPYAYEAPFGVGYLTANFSF